MSDFEFIALEAELAAAGVRARRRVSPEPDPAFAASLRARLLASAPWEGVPAATRPRGESSGGPAWPWPPAPSAPVSHEPVAVRAHLAARTSTVLPAPRWTILAAAAALIVAIVGLNANLLLPVPASSRVTAAVGAQLVRDGATSPLTAGTELQSGDEVRVSKDGSASLSVGDNRIRLAGDADIRLTRLERAQVEIEQIEGRAWHRVVMPPGGSYLVRTDSISWTARGTAFDLDRTGAAAPGGDIVRELSIQHAVVVEGVNLRVTVDEGRQATIRLKVGPAIETAQIDPAVALADAWIRRNVGDDRAAGFPLGALEDFDLAQASAAPPAGTPLPSSSPSVIGSQPPAGSPPAPTPAPTAKPGPKPTSKPAPTPAPTIGTMSLGALACPGGVALDWTVPELASFNHMQVLRAASAEIPALYPPAPGVVAVDGAYTTDPTRTSGYDVSATSQATWYRAVTFDAQDKAIAVSAVKGVTTVAPGDLGALGVSGSTPGELTFSWSSFAGTADCFAFYKLVKAADDPSPSYLTGATALAAIADQAASGTTVAGLPSGSTYWFRVEAIRTTALGKFVIAASTAVQFTVP
ncbi:MAG: hypothetical protein V4515_06145 [Chloroflexota bacterium]